jgi:hypothetical protein
MGFYTVAEMTRHDKRGLRVPSKVFWRLLALGNLSLVTKAGSILHPARSRTQPIEKQTFRTYGQTVRPPGSSFIRLGVQTPGHHIRVYGNAGKAGHSNCRC